MNDNIDLVEFYFTSADANSEMVRRYKVSSLDEAIEKFHLEFPDSDTRPRIHGLSVEHLNSEEP